MTNSYALKPNHHHIDYDFLKDVEDFFGMRRAGHMSNWLYSEAHFEGDKASGADEWVKAIEKAKRDGVYYVFQKERDVIKKFASEKKTFLQDNVRLIDLGPGSVDAISNKIIPIISSSEGRINEYVGVDICAQTLDQASQHILKNCSEVARKSIRKDFIKDKFFYGDKTLSEVAVIFGLTLFNMLIDPRVEYLPDYYLRFSLTRLASHFSTKDGHIIITQDTNRDVDSLKSAYLAIQDHYKSLLYRVSRDLEVVGDYDPDKFFMDVEFIDSTHACALSFVAKEPMVFWIEGKKFDVEKGERFYFHNAYKYSIEKFSDICKAAGFTIVETYKEANNPCVMHVIKTNGAAERN